MSKTFSEIVDIVATQSGYQSNISLITTAVNRAIKQCTPHKHYEQLKEKQYKVENKRGFGKNLEHCFELPQDHRIPLAVRVDNHRIIKLRNPGLGQLYQPEPLFYYLAGNKLFVRSYIASHLDLAYYSVVKNFLYYPLEKRLLRTTCRDEDEALFDYRVPQTDEWINYNPVDPRHNKSYQRHVNWLTKDYSEVLILGALSSAYNSKGAIETGGRLFTEFRNEIKEIKKAYELTRQGEY